MSLVESCSLSAIASWLELGGRRGVAPLTRTVWSSAPSVGEEEHWRDTSQLVVDDYRACVEGLGGRFWVADVVFRSNFTDLDGSGIAPDGGTLFVPKSICAPTGCSHAQVRQLILPIFWLLTLSSAKAEVLMGRRPGGFRLDEGESVLLHPGYHRLVEQAYGHVPRALRGMGTVAAVELGSWEELELSWAILGFEGCGTTSLAANLQRHRSLEVLFVQGNTYWESNFFWRDWPDQLRLTEQRISGLRGRYLPYKSEIKLFNLWRTKDEPTATRRLRGVKSPKYIYDDASIGRIASVPGARAILVVDDPVARIERGYLKNADGWMVHGNKTPEQVPSLGSCLGAACGGPVHYVAPGFYDERGDPEHLQLHIKPDTFAASERVRAVVAAFGPERVFLADRADLALGAVFYDRLALFLGVGAFPAREAFARANAQHDASRSTQELRSLLLEASEPVRGAHLEALATLREGFAAEYEAMRTLFAELPPRREGSNSLPWPAWLPA